jgi:hypothetical protein
MRELLLLSEEAMRIQEGGPRRQEKNYAQNIPTSYFTGILTRDKLLPVFLMPVIKPYPEFVPIP